MFQDRHQIDPQTALDLDRSAQWWIPRLIGFAEVMAIFLIVISMVGFGSLFFSDPLSTIALITDSGFVFYVPAVVK